jgi:outer membrane protein TolC
MSDTHEPREQFVEQLAERIHAEFSRRPSMVRSPRWTQWLLQSPLKAAAAVAILVLISMGLGGIVVAAAYQAQNNEQRAVLIANFEQRAALANQRVAMAREELKNAEQRVSVGLESQDVVLEARFKIVAAEAESKSIQSQLAEIRATGREPLTGVSSPLVSGRDFVTERWQIEMSAPAAALDLEKARLQAAERRFAAGVGSDMDSRVSRTRLLELEAAVDAFRQKLDIRQRFLKREMDATMADLRVLEVEAQQRRRTIEPRIDLARRVAKDVEARQKLGTAQPVELAEAELRLRQLELDSLKAALDLALIQQQILQRLVGR